MAVAQSKLTAQGQISVPAVIRKKLGLVPGSVLEWDEQDGRIVVRKAGRFTFEDMRRVLFPNRPPKPRTLKEMKEGIEREIRRKHGRR
jgi:antitoxin PrlF